LIEVLRPLLYRYSFHPAIIKVVAEFALPGFDSFVGDWYGLYGSHGYENLFCSFEDILSMRTRLQWVKLTGDVNVPAGEISLRLVIDESTSLNEWLHGEQRLRSTEDIHLGDKGFRWGKVRVKLEPDRVQIELSWLELEQPQYMCLNRGSVETV